jgi:hypothetical protein
LDKKVSGAARLPGHVGVGSPEDLDVAHDDHEGPGDEETGDHGPGDVEQGFSGLSTEGGGALEPDQGEDRDDDGQAQVVQRHAVDLELGRVGREPVLEQMMAARARMQATEAASKASVSRDEILMSL